MGENKKILVVEDQDELSTMYSERLMEEGYHVSVAKDGESGIEMILAQNPDFVLLDIMLPKKNGLEVLEIIRSTHGDNRLPFLILTAFPNAEYVERVKAQGAIGFFNKAAITPKDIIYEINKVLKPSMTDIA